MEEAALRGLADDLRRMHDRSGPWQMVIVSGDLTFAGAPEEFAQATDFLDDLLELVRRLNVKRDEHTDPWLLAVPGNHDLQRPEHSSSVVYALRRWRRDATVRGAFWNDPESPYRRVVERAFQPYRRWWADAGGRLRPPRGESYQDGLLPGDFTATLDIGGVRVGVAGLSSAFLQVSARDHEEQLDLDPRQLVVACAGDVPRWVAQHDVALLVTHTPPGWLAPTTQARYRAEINPPGRFLVHLSAHAHDTDLLIERDGDTPSAGLQVQGPSLFGSETWEDHAGRAAPRRHGYHACRLEVDRFRAEADIEVWPRIARPIGGGDIAFTAARELVRLNKNESYTATVALLGRAEPSPSNAKLRGDSYPRGSSVQSAHLLDDATEEAPILDLLRLRDALAARYGDAHEARRLAAEARVDLQHMGAGGAAIDVWHEVVAEAAQSGRLADLVGIARLEYPRDRRIADAWAQYAQPAQPSRRHGPPSGPGPSSDPRAEQLYNRMVQLADVEWRALLTYLGSVAHDVPDASAPPSARAIALVRRAQRDSRFGLARLEQALARVTEPDPIEKRLAAPSEVFRPTAESLERLLSLVLPRDGDFDTFCFDQYPEVYRMFTHGMRRRYRTQLLLEHVDPNDLLGRLRSARPSAWAELRDEIAYE